MMCGHVIIAKGGQLKFDVEQSCGRPPLLVGKTSTCRYKWRFPKSGGTMTYRWMVSWKMPSIYIYGWFEGTPMTYETTKWAMFNVTICWAAESMSAMPNYVEQADRWEDEKMTGDQTKNKFRGLAELYGTVGKKNWCPLKSSKIGAELIESYGCVILPCWLRIWGES